LIGVVLVVRHGDRSPMYTLPNHIGPHLSCSMLSASPPPNHAVDKLRFVRKFLDSSNQDEGRHYVADVHSVVRLNNSKSSHLFHRFGMYPNSTVCSGAQLTVKGTVQMLRLGKFLRSRYPAVHDSSVSSDAKSFVPRIFIRSTEYPRTFQSAVALVYGFSGVSALFSSRFETTRNIYFCSETITNLSCACPAAGKMMWTFKRGRTYSSEERKIRTKIGRIFNVTSSSLPWMPAMMEVRICVQVTFSNHCCM
jgi:2-phosphoxylose phosphatase